MGRGGGGSMRVELIQATPNAGQMVADIASICYGKEQARNPEKLLRHLYENGHQSTLEHVYYTFKLEGISRPCHTQLIRHRLTSPTAESQRYVDQYENAVVIPDTVKAIPEALAIFNNTVLASKNAYRDLRVLGIPKEDARYLLPEGNTTKQYLSLNLRELLHLDKVRDTPHAQWEIRAVVVEMKKLVMEVHPEIAFMFGVMI